MTTSSPHLRAALDAQVASITEWRDVREYGEEGTPFSNGARKMALHVRRELRGYIDMHIATQEHVEALEAQVERVRAAVERGIAGWDLAPTVSGKEDALWWYDYLRSVDNAWRTRLTTALTPQPAATEEGRP